MPRDEFGSALPGDSADADLDDSLLHEAIAQFDPSITPPQRPLLPGDVVGDRFVVERLIGSGGMGTIHRASDLQTREPVAIKVMAASHVGDAMRFSREAAVLADLSHPSIVRYIAHGTTLRGTPFLAMEWLDGEDLAQRLTRSPLAVDEALLLFRRACEGVASAHVRGVVHRDLKPSNLFLLSGVPGSLKVLDFGIARQEENTLTLTQPGTMLGTVGYMSPEQAMGLRHVNARTDVFALGCVLFECLTGRAAFTGPNPVAVLAKVLREESARVSELRPGIGEAIDTFVASLLAKNPDDRPEDATALLRMLEELGDTVDSGSRVSTPTPGLSTGEQKIVSVILGRPRRGRVASSADHDGDMRRMQELTRRFGAEPVALRGGGALVVLSGLGAATDQASQAASCALLLACLRPELRLAVATGRAETTRPVPVGAAIDRAAGLLQSSTDSVAGVSIDELTAGLLDPRFEVRREERRLVLVEERAEGPPARLLMGKPTLFVGREKELALLELTLRECIDESVSRAILVTGPPGQGKSRLRLELVARARERCDIRILVARADPVGAGSAFLLVRQLVRLAAGLREGARANEGEARLRGYLKGVCKGAEAARIADFLGELIGVSPERPGPELRAARDDPQTMGAWLRRSFGEWISAECAVKPLLVVLEDFHWGDLPSVTYLGEALRTLTAKPLMVLALARPEVHEAFPDLWSGAEKQEITLGRLTPRAAERLVREALGIESGAGAVSAMVARADGNPFYLEELIRSAAEGNDGTLPETVLSLLQSRLARLDPETRRVARAASIFGELLWQDGVRALLRSTAGDESVGRELRALVFNEVLTRSPESRFAGESEYAFRHGLLREAAYAMLTDADRTAGHRLAGEWLERTGEQDALTLAEHFELGGVPEQAVSWFVQATQQAIEGGNLPAAFSLGERGIACGAAGGVKGDLLRIRATAFLMRGDTASSIAPGREALDLLPTGTPRWFQCAGTVFGAAVIQGDHGAMGPVLQAILGAPIPPEPSTAYGLAIGFTSMALTMLGEFDLSRSLVERVEAMQKDTASDEPSFVVIRMARSFLQLATGELASAVEGLSEARALADRVQQVPWQAMSRLLLMVALAETGCHDRAQALSHELVALCAPYGLSFHSDRATVPLATSMLNVHLIQDAIALLRPSVDHPDAQLSLSARARLAVALVASGDLGSAAHEASLVLEQSASFPPARPTALAALALVALRRDHLTEAVALADGGLAGGGSWLLDESTLHVVRAEALHALGRKPEAHIAIRKARDRILRIAATFEDLELRQSYLSRIAPNVRTLQLASEWLVEPQSGPLPA